MIASLPTIRRLCNSRRGKDSISIMKKNVWEFVLRLTIKVVIGSLDV